MTAEPEIAVRNFSRAGRVDPSAVTRFVRDLAGWLAVAAGCSVVFVGDSRMRGYNRTYRATDSTTDVLSFPCADTAYIGDIVISLPRAIEQARDAGRAVDDEARALIVHGFLHLLGYDHEVDHGQMRRLEVSLRRRFRSRGLVVGR